MKYWEINIEREIWETIIKKVMRRRRRRRRRKKTESVVGVLERERERERRGDLFWGCCRERRRFRILHYKTRHDTPHTPHHTTGWGCCVPLAGTGFGFVVSVFLNLFSFFSLYFAFSLFFFSPFCFWVFFFLFFFWDFFFFFVL